MALDEFGQEIQDVNHQIPPDDILPEEVIEGEIPPEEGQPERWMDPNNPPPRGHPERNTWFREQRVREQTQLKEQVGSLTQTVQNLQQMLQRPPVPTAQERVDHVVELAKRRGLKPEEIEALKETAEAFGRNVAEQWIQPMARGFFERDIGKEERELMREFSDKNTGYAALRERVMAKATQTGLPLSEAYDLVSAPLVRERLNRVSGSSRQGVLEAKRAMSDGTSRGGAAPSSGSRGITLTKEQKERAEASAPPGTPPAEAHKMWITASKKIQDDKKGTS